MSKPIFIFSLPRAGSTLLQRLLDASGECSSYSEPSFLLRFLGEDNAMDRQAPYGEHLVTRAFSEMESKFPGYQERYYQGIRDLAGRLYSHAGGEVKYFIDKTPRYSLIAREIIRCFPDAKFIFLWRHPGAIAASMAKTWYDGTWDLAYHRVDFTHGFEELHAAWKIAGDQAYSVHYEDLVSDQKEVLTGLGRYLEIENLADVLKKPLPAKDVGTLGDPTGSKKYDSVVGSSRDSWIDSCNNFYRVKVLQGLIRAGSTEKWEEIGYDRQTWEELSRGKYLNGLAEWTRAIPNLLKMWGHAPIIRNLMKNSSKGRPAFTYR